MTTIQKLENGSIRVSINLKGYEDKKYITVKEFLTLYNSNKYENSFINFATILRSIEKFLSFDIHRFNEELDEYVLLTEMSFTSNTVDKNITEASLYITAFNLLGNLVKNYDETQHSVEKLIKT
jgi:hypothetical protein